MTATDLTDPAGTVTRTLTGILGGSPATTAVLDGLTNGHEYRIVVTGSDFAPALGNPCFFASSLSSAPVTTRIDITLPTGTFQVNAGAPATNSRNVTLNLTASDPPSNGQPSSGIGGVQIAQGVNPLSGVVALAATLPLEFADGPDGPRTAHAVFRDLARPPGTAPAIAGNASVMVSDTILLDRVAPTPSVARTGNPVPGGTVQFDASGTVDGLNGPNDSGIATTSWTFGDGASGTGTTIGHAYPVAGTFNGSVTVTDHAGNAAARPFTVDVAAPAAAQPGVVILNTGSGPPATNNGNGPAVVVTQPSKRLTAKVRIRVALGRRLQVLRLNVVGAPTKARIAVRCVRGCTLNRASVSSGPTVNLSALFRGKTLKPGAVIEIRVTKTGFSGQFFRYTLAESGIRGTECSIAPKGGTLSGCTPA